MTKFTLTMLLVAWAIGMILIFRSTVDKDIDNAAIGLSIVIISGSLMVFFPNNKKSNND